MKCYDERVKRVKVLIGRNQNKDASAIFRFSCLSRTTTQHSRFCKTRTNTGVAQRLWPLEKNGSKPVRVGGSTSFLLTCPAHFSDIEPMRARDFVWRVPFSVEWKSVPLYVLIRHCLPETFDWRKTECLLLIMYAVPMTHILITLDKRGRPSFTNLLSPFRVTSTALWTFLSWQVGEKHGLSHKRDRESWAN